MRLIAVNKGDYDHLREVYAHLGYDEKDLRQHIMEIQEAQA